MPLPAREERLPLGGGGRSSTLVDLLDRLLDKGLVVTGDIRISLAEIELVTIRIRLLVCSVDKAEAIGIDWWRADPYFSSLAANGGGKPALPAPAEMKQLEARLAEVDRKLEALLSREAPASAAEEPNGGGEPEPDGHGGA